VRRLAKNLEEKTLFNGEKVEVIGPEYEPGLPEQPIFGEERSGVGKRC